VWLNRLVTATIHSSSVNPFDATRSAGDEK